MGCPLPRKIHGKNAVLCSKRTCEPARSAYSPPEQGLRQLIHKSYYELMQDSPGHIVVQIDVQDPVELLEFTGLFLALANQYERFIKTEYPDIEGGAQIFVRELRSGSMIADLVPWAVSTIEMMDRALIVEQFVKNYASRIMAYFNTGGRLSDTSKTELADILRAVTPIANDPKGTATIEAITYEDKERKVRATLKFNTRQAKTATKEIEKHRIELERSAAADHERVLMIFKRTDIRYVEVGKRSGERVVIEAISPKDLPLVYASRLAEDRVKDVLKYSDENVFKKAFDVDVNVETRDGKPIAYRVKHVHDIIDLPDED